MKRKLWIIGAEGMLGRAVLKICAARGISATGTGKREADITLKEVLTLKALEISPTHIVNCAAYTDVDGAQREYEKAWNINAQGAQNVAEVAQSIGARLIHISTDFVFDGMSAHSYSEEGDVQPVNAYGKSKWEGEQRILDAYPEACIIRTSWLFGSGGKNFFSSLLNWLKAKEEVSVANDQWGRPTYAPDLAYAIMDLLDQKGIFHFANYDAASRFEIAQFAFEEMRRQNIPMTCKCILPVSKESFAVEAPRPSHSILNTEKYTQVTGKQPRIWKEALKEFLIDETIS
jgi:dTDP-4-dehydrorhamnose reductase